MEKFAEIEENLFTVFCLTNSFQCESLAQNSFLLQPCTLHNFLATFYKKKLPTKHTRTDSAQRAKLYYKVADKKEEYWAEVNSNENVIIGAGTSHRNSF